MKRIFLFSFLILIILAGLFIPSYLLNYKSRQKVNSVTEIKQDDHVSPAVLKTASAQLTDYQRMQLISGDWESDVMKAGDAEGELTKSEAVEKAKAGLKELYDNHNYPTDLTSGYNNWYKWDATLYKAVDAHFHSYAAYFWQFHFVRFDNSCSHSVLMMENGTILVAQTNCTEIDSLKHATLPDVKGGSLFEVKPAELSHTPYYKGYEVSNHNLLSCILHIQDTIQLNSYRDYIAYRDADSTKQITATLCYTANQAISQSGSTTKTNQFTYCIIPFSTTPNAQ